MAGVDLTSVAAAGGMKSSLEDMIRWMRFQLADGKAPSGDRLASQRMIQRMRTSHIVVENANPVLFIGLGWLANGATYGLGWFLSSWNGLTVIFHPGFIDGFSAVIALIPQKQLACAVLSNVNLSDTPGLLVRKLFEGVLAPDALRDVSADAKRSPHSGVSVAGIYDNPAYGSVSVDHGSSGMVLRYREREWTLTWTSSTEADFAVEAFGAVIPLKVRFDVESGVASRLQIPFSLDPRVDADVFTRR